MDRVTFIVDDKTGQLAWMAPAHAPDLTDDQARTMAIAMLSGSIDKLAAAVERLADRQADD